jgi:hypothetical protein
VYEKFQMTAFALQEIIISGLYLWETRRLLRPGRRFKEQKTRQVIYHLVWVNIFIIFLDMALLATEYANLFTIQTVFKAAVYSIKLRLEFVVLNQLMELVKGSTLTYEMSNNPSNKYGSARATPNNLLESGQGKPSGDGATSGWMAPNHSYSVSASANKEISTNKELDFQGEGPGDIGVVRTTEVLVHDHAASPTDQICPAPTQYHQRFNSPGRPPEAISTVPRALGRSVSRVSTPTSSEVDFALKGA